MPVNISGKQYVTVAERVAALHEDLASGKIRKVSILTEKLSDTPVVFKAEITIDGNMYMGTSGANPNKGIEKASPYEVAETSAVGRALGFAGYGSVESIASADEITKAKVAPLSDITPENDVLKAHGNGGKCKDCGSLMTVWKEGTGAKGPYAFWSCPNYPHASPVATQQEVDDDFIANIPF